MIIARNDEIYDDETNMRSYPISWGSGDESFKNSFEQKWSSFISISGNHKTAKVDTMIMTRDVDEFVVWTTTNELR